MYKILNILVVLLALTVSACASHKVTRVPELTYNAQMLGKSVQTDGVQFVANPIYTGRKTWNPILMRIFLSTVYCRYS